MGAHEPAGNPASGWRTWRAGPLAACAIIYALALGAGALTLSLLPEGEGMWAPVWRLLLADMVATIVVFAMASLVRNSSIYDPYWSLAPPVLMVWWMMRPESGDLVLREILVLGLVLIWAVRLTINCFRRWRDLNAEDFRYVDLRARSGRLYPLVDLFGIQLMPTLLVFLCCLPLWSVTRSAAPPGVLDVLAFIVTAGAIAIEAVADEQLRTFTRTNRTPGKVCDIGLWRWSQHPNYFGEIAFWWGVWLFGLAAAPDLWWLVAGPVAMTALFVFISVPMMLARKRARRPDYDAQVQGRAVLIPRPPRPAPR